MTDTQQPETGTDTNASSTRNLFSGIQWDGRKTAYTAIGLLVLVLLVLLLRGGGSNESDSGNPTAPAPNTSTTSTTTTASDSTLLENFEFVAGSFPGLQLNTGATPYTCTVDADILGEDSSADLQDGVKKEMKLDGVTLKEVTIQRVTIVLSQDSSRITGFIVRFTGKREDDSEQSLTDVYVGDGTWSAEKSLAFSSDLRALVEGNPIYGGRATGGGHRIRLDLKVPRHVTVED